MVKIPAINTKIMTPRNFVKQMASDGFLPVIALEAFVEAGRTYQAYKRGGFDEARERITEEFSGAVFWLGGVTGLNYVFEKLGQKILNLPKINVATSSDSVRKPLENYLHKYNNITQKKISAFKFAKVMSSVILANAFIGFVLPKINQAITRSYHKNKPQTNSIQSNDVLMQTPNINEFIDNSKKRNENVTFGGALNLLSIADKFENDRNWRLLAVDAGTASGRAISARNNDERVEILFRDLGSIYFYMFNMPNMNAWLNKIQQKGVSSRLDPVNAKFASEYLTNYFEEKKLYGVSIETFKKEILGNENATPESIKALIKDKDAITLENFLNETKKVVSESEFERISKTAQKMSELQPKVKDVSILTKSQVKDIFTGGHINDPEFLKAFFENTFGKKFTNAFKFIAQSDMDSAKADLVRYVEGIIEKANKSGDIVITKKMVSNAAKHNFKMNILNWGSGFAVSALFLSTIIPKLQYLITKLRTGQDSFPGTAQYRENKTA